MAPDTGVGVRAGVRHGDLQDMLRTQVSLIASGRVIVEDRLEASGLRGRGWWLACPLCPGRRRGFRAQEGRRGAVPDHEPMWGGVGHRRRPRTCWRGNGPIARMSAVLEETVVDVQSVSTVSYTHLTLPTNREV